MSSGEAQWSGYSNRLRVGVYWVQSRNPTQADPSYPVYVEGWAQTNYGSYNFDLTGTWYGNWGDGSNSARASNSNPLLLVAGWQTFTASYDGEGSFGFGFIASGSGAGPMNMERYGSVPRRPTANPDPPRWVGLNAVDGPGKLQLTFAAPAEWRGSDSGRRYYWEISTQPNFATTTSTGYQTGGTLNISGSAGVRYYVRVRSEGVWWDATRVSSWVTVNALAPTPPTLTAAPAATNVSRNSWVVPTAQIANNGGQAPINYRVMVNTEPVDNTNIASSGSWSSRPVTGATADTLYYYKVSAYNYGGWGPWTDWTTVRTLDDAPSDPGAPTITDVTETSCTVTWVAPAANGATITGYDLVISDTANPAVPVKSYTGLSTSTLSQAVTGLTKAHNYQAYVRANGTPSSSGWGASGEFRTTGTLATLFPKVNDAGTWKDFELWENQGGAWKKVQLQLNDGGTWKWSEV